MEERFECTTTDVQSLSKLVYVWNIPYFEQQFGLLSANKLNRLFSTTFSSKLEPKTKWTLSISKLHRDLEDYLQVHLAVRNPIGDLTVVDAAIVSDGGGQCYKKRWDVWKPEDTYKVSHDLLKLLISRNGTLTIQYRIETLNIRPKDAVDFDEVAPSLAAMFGTDFLTDLTISVQQQKFRVHKVVLAAASPVFHAMFQHQFQENRTNELAISDFQSEVVLEMLRYVYTGGVDSMDALSQDLLAVAEKYRIEGLKTRCEKHLSDNLSANNLKDMLNLSMLHSARQLEKCVHQFM